MQARAFEPFVTTKEGHKGSGLGLPSVLGIVRQSSGAITCASELGVGTTFTVLLPIVRPAAGSLVAIDDRHGRRPRSSAEVVLIVDDEEGVRGLARRILEARGYVVMDASEGREALSMIENVDTRVDILVCDVVLPGMGGRELAARAIALRPNLKVLFVSGYMHDGAVVGHAAGSLPFLQKPFAPPNLVRAVRDVLDDTFGDGARL
jgi:CheY-like chemotaxis protein